MVKKWSSFLLGLLSFWALFYWVSIPETRSIRTPSGKASGQACTIFLKSVAAGFTAKERPINIEKFLATPINRGYDFAEIAGKDLDFEDMVGVFTSMLPPGERAEYVKRFAGLLDGGDVVMRETPNWRIGQYGADVSNILGNQKRKMSIRWSTRKYDTEEDLYKALLKLVDVNATFEFTPMTMLSLYKKSLKSFNAESTEVLTEKLLNEYVLFTALGDQPKKLRLPPIISTYLGALWVNGRDKKFLLSNFYLSGSWKKVLEEQGPAVFAEHLRVHVGIAQSVRFLNLNVQNVQNVVFLALPIYLTPVILAGYGMFNDAYNVEVDPKDRPVVDEIMEIIKLSQPELAKRMKREISPADLAPFSALLDAMTAAH